MRKPDQKFIQEYASDRDIPCPVCDYNLRGISTSTCPECGARLEIRIGSLDLRLGIWLSALIGTALVAGFPVAGTVITTILTLQGESEPGVFILLAIDAALAGIIVVLIRNRRWFWRKQRSEQLVLAVSAIALSAFILLVGFGVTHSWT